MAPPRSKRTSLAFGDEVVESVLAQLRERLNAEGAVKLSAIKPAALREALEPRLLGEGFEVTPAFVRRPLAAQLHDALAREGVVALSELSHVVRGATRTELEQTVRGAAERGELQHAMRGRTEPLAADRAASRGEGRELLVVGPEQSVLGGERLTVLREACADLAKLLDAASKKKNVGLLASDVEHMLSAALRVLDDDSAQNAPTPTDTSLRDRANTDPARSGAARAARRSAGAPEATGPRASARTATGPRASTPTATGPRASAPTATGPRAASTANARALDAATVLVRLLAAVDAVRDERTGMSFVPAIVQHLSSDMAITAAQDALLSAARRELIELRPEGGLGRLSKEELSLCPPGPAGTRLSWARRTAEEQT